MTIQGPHETRLGTQPANLQTRYCRIHNRWSSTAVLTSDRRSHGIHFIDPPQLLLSSLQGAGLDVCHVDVCPFDAATVAITDI